MLDFAVVGAGMVGCATALALKKRGYSVEVFELRSDPRSASADATVGRSINLAISSRGLTSLRDIDPSMAKRVTRDFVPMHARMVHTVRGEQNSVQYGVDGKDAIYSISRGGLNERLVEEVDKAGIPLHFDHKLTQLQLEDTKATLSFGDHNVTAATIVGCDGTWSRVRSGMLRYEDSKLSMETVDTYYIEMTIPKGRNGPLLDMNHLHIWPRKAFMFIALPNADGSFTGTLFAPSGLLKSLDNYHQFDSWFAVNFPDAYPLVDQNRGNLRKYYESSRGKLVSLKVYPYFHESSAIVLGDAAHSMVPFYGQGLNCGLEDVRVLMQFIDEHTVDRYQDVADPLQARANAFAAYSKYRVDDLYAINDLSMRNYVEMRDSVTTKWFLIRKYVDAVLNRYLGDKWMPLYTMVAFRPDVRYSDAVKVDARQSQLLKSAGQIVFWASVIGLVHLSKHKFSFI